MSPTQLSVFSPMLSHYSATYLLNSLASWQLPISSWCINDFTSRVCLQTSSVLAVFRTSPEERPSPRPSTDVCHRNPPTPYSCLGSLGTEPFAFPFTSAPPLVESHHLAHQGGCIFRGSLFLKAKLTNVKSSCLCLVVPPFYLRQEIWGRQISFPMSVCVSRWPV